MFCLYYSQAYHLQRDLPVHNWMQRRKALARGKFLKCEDLKVISRYDFPSKPGSYFTQNEKQVYNQSRSCLFLNTLIQ